jgi:hypothetical protein
MSENDISSDLRDRLEEHKNEEEKLPGTLVLSENEGYVGDDLTLDGLNFPPNESFEVAWHTSEGRWGVIRANDVHDPQYRPRVETILTVSTDDDGRFTETWEVTPDYGGDHVVEVRTDDGTVLSSSNFTIKPHFELDRTTAPLGEAFHLTGYGLGPDRVTNNYQVTWNNSYVGFLTGVQNRGTANAEIRAVGPPGEHVLQVWRSHRGFPFLQDNTQSPLGPVADGRQSTWTVEVTEPEERPPTAWIDPLLDEEPIDVHMIEPEADTAATLDISPTSGQPGTDAIITGREFPPETNVDLVWHTHTGHRFMDSQVTAEPRPDALPNVRTDESGSFQVEVEVPVDIGETRPITAEVDGTSVAATGFMLQSAIRDITPTEGPVGTEIRVQIESIGFPIYGNNYAVVYDNSFMGYFCSHNRSDSDEEDGLVEIELKAGGQPGLHFIDVIPSFNETQVEELWIDDKPHLSYIDNHPVRPLPAMHFTFEVTE